MTNHTALFDAVTTSVFIDGKRNPPSPRELIISKEMKQVSVGVVYKHSLFTLP